jgi:hypothetical protein
MAKSPRHTGFRFENLEDRRLMAATLPVIYGPMPSARAALTVATLAETDFASQLFTPALVSTAPLGSNATSVSSSATPSIVGFNLVNAGTGQTIMPIIDGMTIDVTALPTRNLNIVPIASGATRSVFWQYDGIYQYNLTNSAPFGMAAAGNWAPALGSHQLFASASTDFNGGGTRSSQAWLNFSVIDSGAGATTAQPMITGYNLVNNSTGAVIQSLPNGASIDLSKLPTTNLNIVPAVNNITKSVFWDYDGQYQYNLTNNAPFAMSTASTWTPTVGNHQLFALAASDLGGGGTRSDQAWLNFTVVNSAPLTTTTTPGTGSNIVVTGGPVPVITAIGTSIMAGNPVTVQGTGTTLLSGTPIDATYLWNFGDPNGKYNSYEGFNAAHIYDTPGTYTLTLTVTDKTGKVGIATTQVNVAPDTRPAIYISNSGNDSNNGLTPATAVKTFDRATALLTDGTKLLLHRGETYDFTDSLYIQHSNTIVSDYGDAAQPAPVVRRAATAPSLIWLIGTSAATQNVTIQDLTFDSVTPDNWNKDGAATAYEPMGKNAAIRNCVVANVNQFVNAESQPDGVLIQDDSSPSPTGLRAYFCWAQGSDITMLGNFGANSTREHDLRVGGTDRLNVSFNNFTNQDRETTDPQDIAKGVFVLQKGSYFFANHNISNGGMGTGPLGGADGTHDPNAQAQWIVVKNNEVHGSIIQIGAASNHVAIDNNVIWDIGGTGININSQDLTTLPDGSLAYPNRNVTDLNIFSNTVISTAPFANFVTLRGHANAGQINLYSNLFIDPNFTTGADQSAAVYVEDNDLSAFAKISGNIWPTVVAATWIQNAEFYVAPQWGLANGYLTAAQWAARPQVSGDVYGSVALPTGAYAETISGVTAGAHLGS